MGANEVAWKLKWLSEILAWLKKETWKHGFKANQWFKAKQLKEKITFQSKNKKIKKEREGENYWTALAWPDFRTWTVLKTQRRSI